MQRNAAARPFLRNAANAALNARRRVYQSGGIPSTPSAPLALIGAFSRVYGRVRFLPCFLFGRFCQRTASSHGEFFKAFLSI